VDTHNQVFAWIWTPGPTQVNTYGWRINATGIITDSCSWHTCSSVTQLSHATLSHDKVAVCNCECRIQRLHQI